jgi:hypothetical protein
MQIEALLKGKLSERPLPAGEIAAAAETLIEGMATTPSKAELSR